MRLPGQRAFLIDGRRVGMLFEDVNDKYVLASLNFGVITNIQGSWEDVNKEIEKMGGRLATASITVGRDYWSNLSENMQVVRDSVLDDQHTGRIDTDRSGGLLDSLDNIQEYLMEVSHE